jgi:hypothetical protein
MRTRGAHRTIRSSVQALGLSILFAGTTLATTAPAMTAASMFTPAAPSTRVIGGPPHQVSPLTDPNPVLQLALPARSFKGVPHQAARVDGPNEALVADKTVPSRTRVFTGVPHQAAPMAARNDDLATVVRATPLFTGVPHQVGPMAGPNDDLRATPSTTRPFSGVPHQVAPAQ